MLVGRIGGERGSCGGCLVLALKKTVGFMQELLADQSSRVKTAEEDGGPEMVGTHLGPEIAGFPGIHHLLDFGNCFHRGILGLIFREMETHSVKQVIVECYK
jgi:hypothetical protein